jgi:hypothetical protein
MPISKLALLTCSLAFSAFAQGPALSIQPSAASVTPGQSFTVAVVASGVKDLFAWQFDLMFPAGQVIANSVTQGPFLGTGGTTFFIPGTPGGAQPLTAATLIGPVPGVSGSGTLATFGFTAITAGPVQLAVTNVILLNSGLAPVSATTTGGSVAVQLAPGPQISVDQQVLNFNYEPDQPAPGPQFLAVTSDVPASFSTTIIGASWLSISPQTASTPSHLSVSIKPAGLAAGHYSGMILVGGIGVIVNLYVFDAPRLLLSASSLSFMYQSGGALPAAQTLYVNSTTRHINLTATASDTWLAVTPLTSQTWAQLSVSVKPAGLAPGTYNGTVAITSADATNSPQTVPVTLIVLPPAS